MRMVVQRVSRAALTADGRPGDTMAGGLLVFVGIKQGDDEAVMRYMADKLIHLRVFEDRAGENEPVRGRNRRGAVPGL